MKRNLQYIVLLSLALFSCSPKQKSVNFTVTETDFLKDHIEMTGQPVKELISGQMLISDDLAILITNDPEGMLKVYSTPDFDLLAHSANAAVPGTRCRAYAP